MSCCASSLGPGMPVDRAGGTPIIRLDYAERPYFIKAKHVKCIAMDIRTTN